ncbi:Nitrate high affinity transporter; pseudogene [Ectocarpus siliculosus]|nr:Nitrate high affinity transporter; pseudogene [Ectocarpus siliculosus]|eukprot:CBJ31726.1 Nitrate high affinity transporter; pseudogene [Ectocarpus siliculosus]
MGCIPTFFAGLVNSATDVAIIRFFIGVMGATFVCTQYWTSQVFAKEFVGTANATSAGWGNLGGGVTQIFMVGVWNAFKTSYDSETAWRLSFLVPAAIVFCVAIGQVFLADDCPKGNYKELEAHGAMTRKSSAVSFKKGYSNVNSWIMFAQYAACFGVELTVNNTAANYFSDEFGLSTSKAGMVASLFGLMNLFARSVGGIWSDFLYRKFGAGVTGMRGRFFAQWTALVWEGCFLFLFTYMNTLGWCGHPHPHPLLRGRADVRGYLIRHRAVHRARRDGRGVGHRGRRR